MWTSNIGKGTKSTRRLATGLSSLLIMTRPRKPSLKVPVGLDVPNDNALLYFILALAPHHFVLSS